MSRSVSRHALAPFVRRALQLSARVVSPGLALGVSLSAISEPFPAVIELSNLDAGDGFALVGAAGDGSGRALSGAGDVNGDGSPDLIIGAPDASPSGEMHAGVAYVVFGGPGVGSNGSVELSALDGSDGFVLVGTLLGDQAGMSVAGAHDVNGDGWPDLLVGAIGVDPLSVGAAYVVFGGPGVGSTGSLALSALDGSDGFVLNGVVQRGTAGTSADVLSDFNDDGYADLIVGADGAASGALSYAGQAYLVFGGPDVGADGSKPLFPLSGSDGFVMSGDEPLDLLGGSVSEAGDINADGIHDAVIGSIWANPGGMGNAGETYVLFGAAGPFAPELTPADLDGSNGFVLPGIAPSDISGLSVSNVGDMNGDGFDDLAIGASQADPQDLDTAGEVYVVFGGPGVGSSGSLALSALDGSNGFVLQGLAPGDNTGAMVAPAGDVTGDGLADLLIGAYKADPGGRNEAGKAYVVFGGPGIGAGGTVSLAALDGGNGFVVNGAIAGDNLTRNASFGAALGDINGDGADDLLIGAPGANPAPEPGGESYVIFGRPVDTDADGVGDRLDNCTLIANVDQRDTNGDGYGNACDPDLNNDDFVNFSDLGMLKSVFFTTDPDADFNGDGGVNFTDLGTMKAFFFQPPGPSGQVTPGS